MSGSPIRLAPHDLQHTTAALDDAHRPTLPASTASERKLSASSSEPSLADRRAERDPVGKSWAAVLAETGAVISAAHGAGRRRRSHLVDAALDGRVVSGGRASRGARDRADGVVDTAPGSPPSQSSHQQRSGRRSGGRCACPRDAPHRVPGRAGAPCRASGVSRRDVRGPASPLGRPRDILSADARRRSDQGVRKSRGVLEGAIARSYYDDVALKGLQLAQADAQRGALDQRRSGQDDAVGDSRQTFEQEPSVGQVRFNYRCGATSAVESVSENAPYENLPTLTGKICT